MTTTTTALRAATGAAVGEPAWRVLQALHIRCGAAGTIASGADVVTASVTAIQSVELRCGWSTSEWETCSDRKPAVDGHAGGRNRGVRWEPSSRARELPLRIRCAHASVRP